MNLGPHLYLPAFLLPTLALVVVTARTSCGPGTLATYEVRLQTFWHRKDFPKHYPEWRPPASWSKMIGFSHNDTFEIFRKGELATPAMKLFAEKGNDKLFDLLAQGRDGVSDAFAIAAINTGVGEGRCSMVVDSNHTKVSMVSKILPSPDWFIGVDSYDLCPHGQWIDLIHLELGPLDAGTDKGMTFTSPTWVSDPQEKIQPIASQYPSHPAGSFYYPQIDELPILAEVTITKKREYSLKDNFDAADRHPFTSVLPDKKKEIYRYDLENNEIFENPKIQKIIDDFQIETTKNQINYKTNEGLRLPYKRYRAPQRKKFSKFLKWKKFKERMLANSTKQNSNQVTGQGVTTTQERTTFPNSISSLEDTLVPERTATPFPLTPSTFIDNRSRNLGLRERNVRRRISSGNVMAVIDDIVKDYQKEHRRLNKRRRREERKRRREKLKKIKAPRDCRVSEWQDWSTCSKTCGIGEQTRVRTILKHARRGGKTCPVLQETTWCGSARGCPRDYFKWQ